VTSAPVGLNGTFSGSIDGMASGRAFTMEVTFSLVQRGNQLVGTWNTTAGTSGTVRGVVRDQTVSEFRAQQVNPCDGSFVGVAAIEGNGRRLRGNYTGNDCNGSVNAAFNLDYRGR